MAGDESDYRAHLRSEPAQRVGETESDCPKLPRQRGKDHRRPYQHHVGRRKRKDRSRVFYGCNSSRDDNSQCYVDGLPELSTPAP